MHDSQMTAQMTAPLTTPQLVMRWIPVRNADGRTVMESCWISASEVAVATAAPEAAHVIHAA